MDSTLPIHRELNQNVLLRDDIDMTDWRKNKHTHTYSHLNYGLENLNKCLLLPLAK